MGLHWPQLDFPPSPQLGSGPRLPMPGLGGTALAVPPHPAPTHGRAVKNFASSLCCGTCTDCLALLSFNCFFQEAGIEK